MVGKIETLIEGRLRRLVLHFEPVINHQVPADYPLDS